MFVLCKLPTTLGQRLEKPVLHSVARLLRNAQEHTVVEDRWLDKVVNMADLTAQRYRAGVVINETAL